MGQEGSVAAAFEVICVVFFTGQISAPRGVTRGTVVDRTARLDAGGRVLGLEQVVAAQRATDVHVGQGGDAAVKGRRQVDLESPIDLVHLHNAHTVQAEFLLHFVGHRSASSRGRWAVGMQEQRRDGLVVDAQQSFVRNRLAPLVVRSQAEVIHAVMMVTGAKIKGSRALGAVIQVGRGGGIDRVAQFVKDFYLVAAGHRHTVVSLIERGGGEVQGLGWARGRGHAVTAAASGQAEERQGRQAQTAAQDAAARRVCERLFQDIVEVRRRLGIDLRHGSFLKRIGAGQARRPARAKNKDTCGSGVQTSRRPPSPPRGSLQPIDGPMPPPKPEDRLSDRWTER